jgi:hypothetical protein
MTLNLHPKTFDDLLGQAEHYARFNLRYRGTLPETLFLLGSQGPTIYVPPPLADEDDRKALAENARLLCVAHGATAAVIAMEAWALLAATGVPFDPNQRPSLSPDRREVVALMGEAPGMQQAKFLPILRDATRTFTGFGAPQLIHADQAQGRFAQLLPAQAPTPAEHARAQAILRARGIVTVAPTPQKPNLRLVPHHRFRC